MKEEFPKLIRLASRFDDIPGKNKKFVGCYRAEDFESIRESQKNLSLIRGEIISSSLNVEDRVNDILVNYFFAKEDIKRKRFQEFFLEKEFFTFMQKWKTLRELLKLGELKIRGKDNSKLILNKIHNVIEVRNNFAHGHIIFFGKNAYLEYLKDGEKIRIRINKKYLSNLSSLFNRTIKLLDYLKVDSHLHSFIV